MLLYAEMCRWMDAACSVSLYVAISYFITTFVIKCYDYEITTELEVRWIEVKLMRFLRFFVVGIV